VTDKARTLSPTVPCPETGRELRRDTRPCTVRCKGHAVVVGLPGHYPDGQASRRPTRDAATTSSCSAASVWRIMMWFNPCTVPANCF
jgi:hypothetical protein